MAREETLVRREPPGAHHEGEKGAVLSRKPDEAGTTVDPAWRVIWCNDPGKGDPIILLFCEPIGIPDSRITLMPRVVTQLEQPVYGLVDGGFFRFFRAFVQTSSEDFDEFSKGHG